MQIKYYVRPAYTFFLHVSTNDSYCCCLNILVFQMVNALSILTADIEIGSVMKLERFSPPYLHLWELLELELEF